MSSYNPPVSEMMFTLYDVLGFAHDELDRETGDAVLGEAAKLARDVLAPLNQVGDAQGAKLNGDEVKTAEGFKEAYQAYCEGGWNAVPFDPEFGGQGLPWALTFPIQEMWQAANMSFGLCPLLNQGAVEAITAHGSQEQKEYYLPKLIEGTWTGTMNLTEPQAGSDLGLLRAKAEKQEDGSYKISGQKIFITYGEHDMAENIIHLVLARADDAPDDVKGISLFIVPKFLEDGQRNDVKCIGLEHKLGIHASPTCTMEFDGAVGYLIGEEHAGLKYMFTMMNNARLSVGLQGIAISEASYQHALAYAADRVQGKSFETGERVSIDKHPDIKRSLLDMKSRIVAGRLMAYEAALSLDAAAQGDEQARGRVDYLTPIVKSWCTDMSVHIASIGIQIHGGMGFVEETGAAQFYRDARILPIYEGTNGIQAADLIFRKVARDNGTAAFTFFDYIAPHADGSSLDALREATKTLLGLAQNKDMEALAWHATPYLEASAYVIADAYLSRSVKSGAVLDGVFGVDELASFFQKNVLPLAIAKLSAI